MAELGPVEITIPERFRHLPSRWVDKLELVNVVSPGSTLDGWGWITKVDGKLAPEIYPDLPNERQMKREKKLLLFAEPFCFLCLVVTWADDSQEVLLPKEFDFELKNLRVTIAPDRNPCRILIGKEEPKVRTLSIEFAEGQCVWANVEFRPE